MRSYLILVAISGKVRKRQNRMTIFCIIISVLLVTAIFSVADMFIRNQSEGLKQKHGNWHIQLENISQGTAEEISHGIEQIAIVVQRNVGSAQSSAAASEELSSQAATLRDLVSKFRLKNE